MKQNKPKSIKKTFAATYRKGENLLNVAMLSSLLDQGLIEGYIIEDGTLSDGNSFAEIHIVIKNNKKCK